METTKLPLSLLPPSYSPPRFAGVVLSTSVAFSDDEFGTPPITDAQSGSVRRESLLSSSSSGSYASAGSSPENHPSVIVVDSLGHAWGSEEIAQLHKGSSGRASWSDAVEESRFQNSSIFYSPMTDGGSFFQEDIRKPRRRTRTASEGCEGDPDSEFLGSSEEIGSSAHDIYCCPEDNQPVKKKGLKNKFLKVISSAWSRKRSASQGEVLFKTPDFRDKPVSADKGTKLFRRRAKSYGDILAPPIHQRIGIRRITDNGDDDPDRFLSRHSSISGEIPPSAINLSLLQKLKNSFKKNPGSIFNSGARRNSYSFGRRRSSSGESLDVTDEETLGDLEENIYGTLTSRRSSVDKTYDIDKLFTTFEVPEEADEESSGNLNIPAICIESPGESSDDALTDHELPVITLDASGESTDEMSDTEGYSRGPQLKTERMTKYSIYGKRAKEAEDFQKSSLRPPLQRLRSLSDPMIVVDGNLKKKNKKENKFITKIKESHRQWKKHRGSLPEIWDKNVSPLLSPLGSDSRRNSSTKDLSGKSRGRLLSGTVASSVFNAVSSLFFFDKAVENYFDHFAEDSDDLDDTGKSRSMDQTLHRPFDLDMFRRKIGERTSSEPTRDIPPSSPGSFHTNGPRRSLD